MPKTAAPKIRPVHCDPFAEPEKYDFLVKLGELKKSAPREYRALVGVMRALYLDNNPRAPRDRHGRDVHTRALAKVRPLDFRRAQALPGIVAGPERRQAKAVAA